MAMVPRNHDDKNETNAREEPAELEPCQKPVDSRKTRKALKAFIAACGGAAAAATVVLAASNPITIDDIAYALRDTWRRIAQPAGVAIPLLGESPAIEITTEPVEEGEDSPTDDDQETILEHLRGIPEHLMGSAIPARIEVDDE